MSKIFYSLFFFHMLTCHRTMLMCQGALNSLVKLWTELRFGPWPRSNGMHFPRVGTRLVISPNFQSPNGTNHLFPLIICLAKPLFKIDHFGLEKLLDRWLDQSSRLTATIENSVTAYVPNGPRVWSSCTNALGHVPDAWTSCPLRITWAYLMHPILVKPL